MLIHALALAITIALFPEEYTRLRKLEDAVHLRAMQNMRNGYC